jgi:hypothetical protein
VKVVLTGQGIDEILAGYHPSFRHFLSTGMRAALRGRVAPSYRQVPLFADQILSVLHSNVERDGLMPAGAAHLTVSLLRRYHESLSRGLLRFEDRMSMAAGVEARVPLLDHCLIELVASIPQDLRGQLLSSKALLREAVRPWLPASVASRPKFGFNAGCIPLTRALELSGSAGEELRYLISREAILKTGYFEYEAVRDMMRRREYSALDHVLVVQMLDDVFVARFDPARFAPPFASAPERVCEVATKRGIRPDDIPRLNQSVVRVRLELCSDAKGRGRLRGERAFVDFAEPLRSPVEIPAAGLAVLRLIDGRRTFREVANCFRKTPLAEVLRFAEEMVEQGIVSTACGELRQRRIAVGRRLRAALRRSLPRVSSTGTHGGRP